VAAYCHPQIDSAYRWASRIVTQPPSKVISAIVRDATYVLDAILDNETELEIAEDTTDTSG
jgi:TnpA family transposase